MLPAPPSPWVTSTLAMNWGNSFGIKFLESMIKALNMRDGAIGHKNSCEILVTPIICRLNCKRKRWIKNWLYKSVETSVTIYIYIYRWKSILKRTSMIRTRMVFKVSVFWPLSWNLDFLVQTSKILVKKIHSLMFINTWAALISNCSILDTMRSKFSNSFFYLTLWTNFRNTG